MRLWDFHLLNLKIFIIELWREKLFMKHLVRYGLVGLTSNLIMYVVYLWITYCGLDPKAAMTIVYMAGASLVFVGNREWTFSNKSEFGEVAQRFVIVYTLGYVLNLLVMWVAVDCLEKPHYLVQGVSLIIMSALLFLAQKYWVFAVTTRT